MTQFIPELPINNINQLTQQMDLIFQNSEPANQKIDALAQLIENNGKFLKGTSALKLNEWAKSLEHIPTESADQAHLRKVRAAAETLRAYAHSGELPDELMGPVVGYAVQRQGDTVQNKYQPPEDTAQDKQDKADAIKSFKALIRTSHTTRRQALQAFRRPLRDLNIKTAEAAIHFVKQFGQDLTYIDIGKIKFKPAELEELLKYLPNISVLKANYCYIDREGAKVIAASPNLSKLRSLSLNGNGIGEEGAEALATSPYLSNLTRLDLECGEYDPEEKVDPIGPKGAKAFADSPYLTNLRQLNLEGNEIGDAGAKALAASKNSSKLTQLNLKGNDIGFEQFKIS